MKKGWQTKKLADLVEVQNGYAFSSKDYSESGHFLMRIGNVQNGYISTADPKFIKLPADGSLQRFVLSEDDILVSLTGNVGRVGVIQESHLPAALNQRVARISIRKDSPATRELILLFLCSDWFREELIGAGHGAAQQNVSTKDLVEIEIPVPPLAEQQRIVGLLDEAFEGLATAKANAENNLQNARALFESHLQSVFTQRGEGSQTKTLEEACQFSNGLWKGEKPPFVKVGVIRNTNFTKEGTLDDSDIAYLDVEAKKLEKRRLQFGDIILEKSGGGPKQPVGRVALFDKQEGDFSFSNFTAALRVLDPDELDFRFVHRFLHWTYLSGVTKGMQSNSTGIRNLDGDAYKAIDISFPPLAEQQRIVAQLDALSQETQRLARLYERKHAALEALKKSLLHQAFTGEL